MSHVPRAAAVLFGSASSKVLVSASLSDLLVLNPRVLAVLRGVIEHSDNHAKEQGDVDHYTSDLLNYQYRSQNGLDFEEVVQRHEWA